MESHLPLILMAHKLKHMELWSMRFYAVNLSLLHCTKQNVLKWGHIIQVALEMHHHFISTDRTESFVLLLYFIK